MALVTVSLVASAATPLECPKGTRLESRDGGAFEFCVDSSTGLKEGPERQFRPNGSLAAEGVNRADKPEGVVRLYGEDGILMGEMLYENGRVKSTHMTLAGLRYQADRQNARFRAANKAYLISVIDERTLMWDMRVEHSAPLSPDEKAIMRDLFQKDPDRCRILAGMGVETINFRILSPKAELLDQFALSASECKASQR